MLTQAKGSSFAESTTCGQSFASMDGRSGEKGEEDDLASSGVGSLSQPFPKRLASSTCPAQSSGTVPRHQSQQHPAVASRAASTLLQHNTSSPQLGSTTDILRAPSNTLADSVTGNPSSSRRLLRIGGQSVYPAPAQVHPTPRTTQQHHDACGGKPSEAPLASYSQAPLSPTLLPNTTETVATGAGLNTAANEETSSPESTVQAVMQPDFQPSLQPQSQPQPQPQGLWEVSAQLVTDPVTGRWVVVLSLQAQYQKWLYPASACMRASAAAVHTLLCALPTSVAGLACLQVTSLNLSTSNHDLPECG
jgi:hypothetical protein